MPDIDPEKFLNTPIYDFDFQFMIGDVKDFLEFSENNIDLQYQRELQAISHRKNWDESPSGYREHLEQNIDHRFRVSLPLSIRYGAVLALTTSVEWSVKHLNKQALEPIKDKTNKEDETNIVKVLKELAARARLSAQPTIDNFEALVYVRNCIAHSAGILETYRHKKALPSAVARLHGFSLTDWHIFGDHVCIERGALNPYIDQMRELVINLHRTMHEKGLCSHENL